MDLVVLLTLATTVFITSLSGALMPGPVLIVTVSEATKRGFIAGPLIVLGHIIVESIIITGLLLGLGAFLQLKPVLVTIGILGGAALTWMGYSTLKAAYRKQVSLSNELEKAKTVNYGPTISGIVTSLSNPYFFLWWATIGIGLLSIFIRSAGTVNLFIALLFAVSHWMSDIIWYSAISFSIEKGRQKIMSEKTYRTIIGACGVFLLVFGTYFVLDALRAIIT